MRKTIIVRQLTLGDGIPKICIPLTGQTNDELLAQVTALKEVPHDLVEWRVDYYTQYHALPAVEKTLQMLRGALRETPLLFTFRTQAEGGTQPITPLTYLSLNLGAIASGFVDMIDVEFISTYPADVETLIRTAHENGVKVVASNHEFHQTPSCHELVERLTAMHKAGADIPKIAVMPTCKEDVLALIEATVKVSSIPGFPPVITMSMGALGGISRLLGEFTGSCITFGSAGQASAPGQIPAGKLKELLTQLHEVL